MRLSLATGWTFEQIDAMPEARLRLYMAHEATAFPFGEQFLNQAIGWLVFAYRAANGDRNVQFRDCQPFPGRRRRGKVRDMKAAMQAALDSAEL